MNYFSKIFTALTLLVLSLNTFGQNTKTIQDFGTWTGLKWEKKLKKKFTLESAQELRLNHNSSKIDAIYSELGLVYKANKWVYLSPCLRESYKNTSSGRDVIETRYNLDLTLIQKIKSKWSFSYRLRFQQNFINPFIKDYYRGFSTSYRNRIKISFKSSEKNQLYFSAEIFRKKEQLLSTYWSKVRLVLGDKFKLKKNAINLSFGLEQELNSEHPLSFFIVRARYKFKL